MHCLTLAGNMVGRLYEHGPVCKLSDGIKKPFTSSRRQVHHGRVDMASCQPGVCLVANSGFVRASPAHLPWIASEKSSQKVLSQDGVTSELMTFKCSTLQPSRYWRMKSSNKRILSEFFLTFACFISLLVLHTLVLNWYVSLTGMLICIYLLWYVRGKGNRRNKLILVNMFK